MIFQTKTKTPITPITETERSAFCREETNLETKPLVEETKSKARWQKIPIEYMRLTPDELDTRISKSKNKLKIIKLHLFNLVCFKLIDLNFTS